MEKGIKKNDFPPGSVLGAVCSFRAGRSLRVAPAYGKPYTYDLQKGTRLKFRPTGALFEIKKITNQFVILGSIDGPRQIMTEKNSVTCLFDF